MAITTTWSVTGHATDKDADGAVFLNLLVNGSTKLMVRHPTVLLKAANCVLHQMTLLHQTSSRMLI